MYQIIFLLLFQNQLVKEFFLKYKFFFAFSYLVNLTSLEILTANNNQIEHLPNNIGK